MKATSKKTDYDQILPGLDDIITRLHESGATGLSRAYMLSEALTQLNERLDESFVDKMMILQGTRVGFKTDLDNKEGYPREIVKKCIIEALVIGVQPYGNQFNIINGGCYTTKEGFKELLDNLSGLTWNITPGIPRVNADKVSAVIPMMVEWTLNGNTSLKELEVSVTWNQNMTFDAGVGKAERRSRAWLYNAITGLDIGDGDVGEAAREKQNKITLEDLTSAFEQNKSKLSKSELKDAERIIDGKEVDSYKKMLNIITSKA